MGQFKNYNVLMPDLYFAQHYYRYIYVHTIKIGNKSIKNKMQTICVLTISSFMIIFLHLFIINHTFLIIIIIA